MTFCSGKAAAFARQIGQVEGLQYRVARRFSVVNGGPEHHPLGMADLAEGEGNGGHHEGAANDDEDRRDVQEGGGLPAQHHGAGDHGKGAADTQQGGEINSRPEAWHIGAITT